jgi:hypothetical protein
MPFLSLNPDGILAKLFGQDVRRPLPPVWDPRQRQDGGDDISGQMTPCMLSYVKLFDNTTVGELRDLDFYDIVRKLRGIFSESQLNWMEQCFEGCPYNKITNLYYNKYCKDKKDRKSLLKAIMKNIIKNNGIFKPQQEVSVSDSLRQNIPFTYATLY